MVRFAFVIRYGLETERVTFYSRKMSSAWKIAFKYAQQQADERKQSLSSIDYEGCM